MIEILIDIYKLSKALPFLMNFPSLLASFKEA